MFDTCAWANASPKRIVDLYFGQTQPRRAVAVHDQIGLEAAGLQIRIDVGYFGHVLQRRAKLLRPGAQFRQIVAEQGVLILAVRRSAAAAAEVLDRLQEDVHPRDRGKFWPQARDDPVG